MRLTDEERAIADRVAERMAEENDADDAWGHAMLYIASRREAFGDTGPPGTATAAGVAAPPAEASDEVVAWMVASPTGDASAVFHVREDAVRFARGVHGIVPLVRQGSPRGVVVTQEQRWAVEWAMGFAQANSFHALAGQLSSLLDAIYAAKEGAT